MKEYIEKSALIDALMMYTWRDEDDREIDDAEEKRAFIEGWFPNLPAADVREVKRGKWIMTTERFAPERICSSCECRFPVAAGEGVKEILNFCPNCGADCRGGNDGE